MMKWVESCKIPIWVTVIVALLTWPSMAPTAEAGPPLRVLFIGNSYTSANNLPKMFARLADSLGRPVKVGMSTRGGWTLADHASSGATIRQIEEHSWDMVVLQEQSVIPSVEVTRSRLMYPAGRVLDRKIRARGPEIVLFMTWGRRDGLPEEGHDTFEDMQAQLEEGYTELARRLGAVVAPVGIAWLNALEANPELNLWTRDGSHPNRKGSYLAACVFYAVFFRQSPLGASFPAGLNEREARFFQTVAANTVL